MEAQFEELMHDRRGLLSGNQTSDIREFIEGVIERLREVVRHH